jgi:3-methylfumaryl-CoA hydratase
MYARGRVDMSEAPVARIDMPLHRRSLVTSVTQKSGRFDKMVFVEVTHELSTAGLLFCTDIQDLVYLGDETSRSPTNFETQTHRLGDDGSWIWRRELAIDETLLFRFSALTYNAHRIHYDQKYATNIEGYPDLVVHAPLQALALAELCRFHLGERRILSFGFRAKRPAFNGAPLQLRGRLIDEQHVELEAIDSEGLTTMSAVAILASK